MAYVIWTEAQVRSYAYMMAKAVDKSLREGGLNPLDVKAKWARDVYVEQIERYYASRDLKPDPSLMTMLKDSGRLAQEFDKVWVEYQRRLDSDSGVIKPINPVVKKKLHKRVF